ncbi:alpha-ketoglutarate-dependent dioxygenase AlkB [Scytonema sp. UIC 10036]|uniref:alpha-ketoglutarate-dependent dioxygenase AlkB family protein n=1 Tax=Scytonema sp. UIC 10036 TaxID=2304196 RepID=UPI0012DADB96|nr:alpha-ketoglutarate-dependent dioxygenase AlkB [Scytonema sp. UIC 10036]MUG96173.1 alpha-ketoglutarate-dependent dioxygenase AlkB [Scytonema sp. UIC 10036]
MNDRFSHNQLSLLEEFEKSHHKIGSSLPMPDADVIVYDNFFSDNESDTIFSVLYETVTWRQEVTYLYGKQVALPRLTAWFGDKGKSYTYSKIKMEPQPWIPVLKAIKLQIEEASCQQFNSVLLNLYRDGRDSIAWHSDDEKELGTNPVIGSVSFGGTRHLMFRHKQTKELKFNIELTHGSLLLMQGTTQQFWQHQIAKTSKPVQPRINLTFRQII